VTGDERRWYDEDHKKMELWKEPGASTALKRLFGFVPAFRAGAVLASMTAAAGVGFAVSLSVYRADGETPRLITSDSKQPTVSAAQPERLADRSA
jgi:hypothetical protein